MRQRCSHMERSYSEVWEVWEVWPPVWEVWPPVGVAPPVMAAVRAHTLVQFSYLWGRGGAPW